MSDQFVAPPAARRENRFSRRAALQRAGAATVVAGLASAVPAARFTSAQAAGATPVAAPSVLSNDLLLALESDIATALTMFSVPGAAVAFVQGDQVVYSRGFGVRDLDRKQPVTEHTRFRLGSNTKSMTSLLLATFVDQGSFGWDDRVIDMWPAFRAPTANLTARLRLRDLLGMGSGLAESETIEFFASDGGSSALDLARSVAYQSVIGPPDTRYAYNNTLVCVAAYLTSLTRNDPPAVWEESYAALVDERIFTPIGMTDSAIAADPQRLGDDFAVGHVVDLFGRPSATPFISIGGAAPAGSGLSSAADMARFLITQMNGGVAPGGARIVSPANLAETHRPGITVPPDALNALPSVLLPDTAAMHYCQGWFDQTFKNGRHLLWHAGGIDGFASLMGFFPDEKLGFVLLTNLEPAQGGSLFNFSVQSSWLSRLFGLNQDLPALLSSFVPLLAGQTAKIADRTRPVDSAAIAPYLGLYGGRFQLRLGDDNELRLSHDIRTFPLLALADGGYVVTNGPGSISRKTAIFSHDETGTPMMTIDGFNPARWLTSG